MKSFILAALAGAASAITPIENLLSIVPTTTISTKATTPVALGTVVVNSGWSKTGTGQDAAINLKMEIVTTQVAANNFTGASDVWFTAFSKDATTASTELMRTSFTTTTATATVPATTTMTCSTVTIPFNSQLASLAPQTEFAKITTGQKVSTSILQADGFGNKDVPTITNAWIPDQAGASNSATAWTMRWTRTPADASAFGAKIGGTVYAGIWYNKGVDINNLWKIQAPFQWLSDSVAPGGACATGFQCVACTDSACDKTLACKTSAAATGNCTFDCSAATAKLDAKFKINPTDPTIDTDVAALGAGCSWTKPPAPPANADCVALKAAVDAATALKVQANIDSTTTAWKNAGCDATKKDASALYSSLAAVVVGIFATAF